MSKTLKINVWDSLPDIFNEISKRLQLGSPSHLAESHILSLSKVFDVLVEFPDIYIKASKQFLADCLVILNGVPSMNRELREERSMMLQNEFQESVSPLLSLANNIFRTLFILQDSNQMSPVDIEDVKVLSGDLLLVVLQSLEKPVICCLPKLLENCRVYWAFLKRNKPCVLLSVMVPHLQRIAICSLNFEDERKRLMILRFAMELSSEIKVSLVSTVFTSVSLSTDIFSVLATVIQFAEENEMMELASNKKEIFVLMRSALKSTNSIHSKLSTYIIKSLTSFFAERKDFGMLALDKNSQLLLHLPKLAFVKYWTDFFDLYEVLEEKQIHIIRPFFPKLEDIKLNSEAAIEWYFVILYKMMQHDNRGVAKEGAERFLEYSEILKDENVINSEVKKSQFLQFIENTLFPILRDQVGWIFKEGDEFFRYSDRIGETLAFIFNKPHGRILVTQTIMGFILQADKGLGAHFLYFLILTLDSALKRFAVLSGMLVGERYSESPPKESSIALTMIERYLNHSLTTIDKFMKTEIEKKLVEIFKTLFLSENVETYSGINKDTALAFIGGLRKSVFCYNKCFQELQNLPIKYVEITTSSVHGLTTNQTRGLFRWNLLCLLKENQHQRETNEALCNFFRLCLQLSDSTYWSPATVAATEDILKCVQILQTGKHSDELQCQSLKNAFNSFVSTGEVWKALENILHVIFTKGVSSDTFLNAIKVLHTIELLCNLSETLRQTLSESIKSVTTLPFIVRFGSSNINDFVLCRIYVFFADTCNLQTSRIASVEGFENFFLTGNVSGDPNFESSELYLEAFKENLSCTYYQLKFRMFTMKTKVSDSETFPTEYPFQLWEQYISVGLDTMDIAGQRGVVAATPFFYECSRSIEMSNAESLQKDKLGLQIQKFVDISWKHIDEQRKTENYWKSYGALVEFMTTPSSIVNWEAFNNFVEKTFLYGETIMGMSLVLLNGLKKYWKHSFAYACSNSDSEKFYRNILNVCVSSVCFGPPMVKTLKVDFSIWESIIAGNLHEISDEVLSANNFSSASQTRVLSLMFIQMVLTNDQMLQKRSTKSEQFLKDVVNKLLKINDEESAFRKRYFNNSTSHRLKQRITQALLVLQHLFSRDIRREVTMKLLESLAYDSSQPSVRYLMEWVIIRNLGCDNLDWDIFFEESVKCSKAREGFGAFFATICLHTTALLEDNDFSKIFFEKALRNLTDLLLGKHFTVRVYSLISFQRIYETAKMRNWTSVIQPFEVIYTSLKNFCLTGNFTKIHQNIINDFYVNIFHAETNYNFPVIFIHLPRIAGMTNDELIPEPTLNALCEEFGQNYKFESKSMPLLHCSSSLVKAYKEYQKSVWLFRAVLGGRELGEMIPVEGLKIDLPSNPDVSTDLVNLQKKMNPWKFLPVVDDVADFAEQFQLRKSNLAEDGLIVVASLIDRAPNLGGLCRTCEIFGVSKYVISSMKILDDNQFKNLSVSSHSWVDILEVPVKDLEIFLASYASKGYTIIGVEQATESTKLNSYKFPKKSLLLLGNEKFGIPTNLLHLLNQCLEIPQVGVIRSLNVHVTGALCIWEYASQHVI